MVVTFSRTFTFVKRPCKIEMKSWDKDDDISKHVLLKYLHWAQLKVLGTCTYCQLHQNMQTDCSRAALCHMCVGVRSGVHIIRCKKVVMIMIRKQLQLIGFCTIILPIHVLPISHSAVVICNRGCFILCER